ncbi:hypothetical protein LWI28_027792 [Acer negundo]|uniref:Protein yippee-like n=1 Tax=Acer negundo TaxID=4023 RepID=A0AAD5IC13_ACENE|nr:hypothetical protein LWI28_027792 [Acer negundo]
MRTRRCGGTASCRRPVDDGVRRDGCRLLTTERRLSGWLRVSQGIGLRIWGFCAGFSGSSSTSPSSLKGKFSKAFQGRNGRAFLFSHAMNVVVGPKEDRHLLTGLHTVADISCVDCREVLGWKYERAYEASQKYKEGKFILEKSKIVKENW